MWVVYRYGYIGANRYGVCKYMYVYIYIYKVGVSGYVGVGIHVWGTR